MPPAVVGLALVGGGAITAATLGYVALGVTVAGMVTKNKTLMKIGGQLGLAAGVAGIAQSFMGAGAAGTAGAASTAGDVAKVAVGAGNEVVSLPDAAQTKPIAVDSTTSDRGTSAAQWDTAPNYKGEMPDTVVNKAPVGFGDPTSNQNKFDSPAFGPGAGQGANQGTTQGLAQGSTQGTTQGTGIAPVTANDPATSTQTKPDSNFFSFMNKDMNKYAMVEGGKVIAGGLQGMAATSNANVQLEENRRIGDIQRANAASVGRSNYGLMGAR